MRDYGRNRFVNGMCALTIGDFKTTKLKYLSIPISILIRRSIIVWYSSIPVVTNFTR
ncbi:hypothetical protein EV184_110256 [Sinorhizobium americanum]|uniref:Uncharacterized protein n=1 Tax=Sinorhizobium americanum TaxID=194963 RepID=A0A4R2BS44_9HYPH|nr:hypothetical protein EV184_110256 [Sinorhizobium americanum]